jgi:hypothetical protein
MGQEEIVEGAPPSLRELLERLSSVGLPATVMMVDGALQMPGLVPEGDWRDVRLRTPAGTVTLARRPAGVAVVVFGNADEALRAAQRQVADAIRALRHERS